MADGVQRVRTILNAARVDEVVIVHMIDALQISNVTDFVNYVEHSKYEVELGSFILETLPQDGEQPHALAESRIQLTRLRRAWEAEKRKKRKLEGAVDDNDEPLGEMSRRDLLNQFIAPHSLTPLHAPYAS